MSEIKRKPNWEVWRHVPEAKLWEAVALSLDVEPKTVKIDRNSWMGNRLLFHESEEFQDRVFLAVRNLGVKLRPTLTNIGVTESCMVALTNFATWAVSVGWTVPPELSAMSGPGEEERVAPPDLDGKSRQTLLKLVFCMAMDGYGYKPDAARSPIPKEIADVLTRSGFSITDETVREWLKKAAEELEWRQPTDQ